MYPSLWTPVLQALILLDLFWTKLVEHPLCFHISVWFSPNLKHLTLIQNRRQKIFNMQTYRLCRGTWHSKNWQNCWFLVFHISILGTCLDYIRQPKPLSTTGLHWYVVVKGRTSLSMPLYKPPLYYKFVAQKQDRNKLKMILSWLHYWHANLRVSLKSSSSLVSFRSVKNGSLIRPTGFARTIYSCL